jgi:hypothetical protein
MLRDVLLRVRALLVPRRVERELDEELAFHIERETQKHLADGLSAAAARARARAHFGSISLAADQCRDARGTAFVDTLARDILFAFAPSGARPSLRSPSSRRWHWVLGLITVVFRSTTSPFFASMRYENPGELFAVERPTAPGADAWLPFTRAEYDAIRARPPSSPMPSPCCAPFDTHRRPPCNRRPSSLETSSRCWESGPALGRALTPDDDERSVGRPVIVLSHRGWNKLFASDPMVIGRTVRINGLPYEIVGVTPGGLSRARHRPARLLGAARTRRSIPR